PRSFAMLRIDRPWRCMLLMSTQASSVSIPASGSVAVRKVRDQRTFEGESWPLPLRGSGPTPPPPGVGQFSTVASGTIYIAPDFLGHRFGVEEGVERSSEAC